MDKEGLMPPADEELMKLARRRAKMKLGFIWHVTAYVLVNCFLIFLNFMTGGSGWVVWPIMGWGLGLAFHGISVLFELANLNPGRMASAEYARLKRSAGEDVNYDYYVNEKDSREN